ncbi:MAG TPA: ABC transporter permease [Candidatus Limnocylindrales bacterium]|nr:ABC transporter permease [Candidatus Limnocylindrales bacterium]
MFQRRRWLIPWLLMAPGLLWLIVFFVIPNVQMVIMSLSSGTLGTGYRFTGNVGNYGEALTAFPTQFRNSIVYGGLATILTFVIGFPLAYGIAFRGGRYKNILLFLVIAPFFTSFLIRTISWRIILGESGPVLWLGRDALGLFPDNFTILRTPLAVVSGLVYQFLPFMVLPLYTSLEKVDFRLVEAARDLYAGPWRRTGAIVGGVFGALLGAAVLLGLGYASIGGDGTAVLVVGAVVVGLFGAAVGGLLISEAFVRVIFPLSLPGVFAGSILTFIPAIGDYVNAELLGNPRTQMIGNVIQSRFLEQNDYPTASALAFILMIAILVAIFIYARLLGTEELSGGR